MYKWDLMVHAENILPHPNNRKLKYYFIAYILVDLVLEKYMPNMVVTCIQCVNLNQKVPGLPPV